MVISRFEDLEYVFRRPNADSHKYPVIIFLHGAGTLGGKAEQLTWNPVFSENSVFSKPDFPFAVFAPHCKASCWFDIFEQLQRFVKFIAEKPEVDAERIYLIGNSMGGYGAWQLAMTMPEYFAAIIPICGGGMYWNAERLKNVGVWAVHGKKDTTVYPEESINMISRLKQFNPDAKLTLLEDVNHNSWDYVWENEMFYDWLLTHKKTNISAECSKPLGESKNFG